ncbi:MAG: DUF4910 domain-containing protein [Thermoplasmata archaeon]|nr:DUF4910 domain-containing protein [Thermoplasmata archaeon]
MELGKVVKDELSGSSAKSYVAGLTEFHRIQGSPMMRDAAVYVKEELVKMGMEDATIEHYPADGRRKYWTYTSVMGWDVRSAELSLVEPDVRVLARHEEVPQSLHTFSRSTPKQGVTAELVDVGKGLSDEDYAGKSVKGKFVLTTGKGKTVQHEAVVKRGAAGVITDSLTYEFPGVRESIDIPDAHSYQGIWPNAKSAGKIKFGFSLSKRQGNELRDLLRSAKPVRLHAKVDADLSPGRYSVVTCTFRGSDMPDEEIVLVAHLCHPKPSANDNASGSGLLLELARTITSLVASGKIKRPRRTIRLLWVPETVGSVAYLSKHPELHKRLVAGINMDMVGEDQARCKSTLCMDCTPDTMPSYLNDLVYSMMGRSNSEYDSMVKLGIPGNFRYTRTQFTGGSDHAEFNESTVGVPCVSLTQWPDLFYHTSMDTIDNVSEDSLRRVGWAAATSALTLASADSRMVRKLAILVCSEGIRRISEAVEAAAMELYEAFDPSDNGVEFNRVAQYHGLRVRHSVRREVRAVLSVRRLDKAAGSDDFVKSQAEAVEEHGSREQLRLDSIIVAVSDGRASVKRGAMRLSKAEKEAKAIVPRRRFKGTLDADLMSEKLGEERYGWYGKVETKDPQFTRKMYEVVNLMDGRRSLADITEFVSAEYGPTDHKNVLRFVQDLKSIELVTY